MTEGVSLHIDYCYITSSPGLRSKGVEAVVDCPIGGAGVEVDSVSQVRELVSSAFSTVFGMDANPAYDSSEPIGYTHVLYRFRVHIDSAHYIGARLVLRGKRVLRAIFTVPVGVNVSVRWPATERYSPREELFEHTTPRERKYGAPPGQVYIDVPVVYAIFGVPRVDVSSWVLEVNGDVENPLTITLPEIYELGLDKLETDFHCVTGWSVKSLEFAGVSLCKVVNLAKPMQRVEWVYTEGMDGYSAVFPLSDACNPRSIIALEMNGEPLDILHGYPARLIIPDLYGWKSVKWLRRISLYEEYRDGYWEALGYHPRGRVWLEERFKVR